MNAKRSAAAAGMILGVFLFFPHVVPAPILEREAPLRLSPPPVTMEKPAEYVRRIADEEGVPRSLADRVWLLECSRRVICKDGLIGERGPFQMTRDASKEVGGRWAMMRDFRHGVRSGIRYLKLAYHRCGRSWAMAVQYYRKGACLTGGKLWAHAIEAGMIVARERGSG